MYISILEVLNTLIKSHLYPFTQLMLIVYTLNEIVKRFLFYTYCQLQGTAGISIPIIKIQIKHMLLVNSIDQS